MECPFGKPKKIMICPTKWTTLPMVILGGRLINPRNDDSPSVKQGESRLPKSAFGRQFGVSPSRARSLKGCNGLLPTMGRVRASGPKNSTESPWWLRFFGGERPKSVTVTSQVDWPKKV